MADSRRPLRSPSDPPPNATSTAPPRSRSTYPASGAMPSSAPPPSSSRFASVPPSQRPDGDVIVAFPGLRATIPRATLFRSTWIVSSLQSLRERGHFPRYASRLAAHRDTILECVAGIWLPIDVAHAHYGACDALGLDVEEQIAMGRVVGARAQGTLLATAVKAARGAGVTPWTILPQFDRLWRRGANGGAVMVTKVGPKEARAEFVGCDLFDVPYFRNGFRGVLLGIGDMFCKAPYVHDLPRRLTGEAAFHLQWV